MEKPFTINAASTAELIALAKSKGLAIHENYMFAYHAQLAAIQQLIESGAIGQIRLIRIDFGFPRRAQNDFRYNKALGGGALLDAGGYPLRYATMLLGTKAKLLAATANYLPDAEVDMYGTAMLANDTGTTVQIGFGMDNAYRCDLNVWGSTGTLQTGRILTAPAGFTPTVEVIIANGKEIIELPDDDAFRNSIEVFLHCIANPEIREQRYQEIQQQADLVSQFQTVAGIA